MLPPSKSDFCSLLQRTGPFPHVCRLSSIFSDAHVAGKNDFIWFPR